MSGKLAYLVYKNLMLIEAKRGVFKNKSDYVAKGVIPIVNAFWRSQKSRAIQADQIIAVYEKVAEKRNFYSWRSASIGSRRDARRAGKNPKPIPMAALTKTLTLSASEAHAKYGSIRSSQGTRRASN